METNTRPSRPFIGFDIETEPNEQAARLLYVPPPPFDPEAVKMGNVKDPFLRREKLEAARAEHAKSTEDAERRFIERAALSAMTGRVCAIGVITHDGCVRVETKRDVSERDMIANFWAAFAAQGEAATRFVFWSGSGATDSAFDIDFLFQRSLILGIPVPVQVRPLGSRFYSDRIVDLATRFLLGKREAYLSLTAAAEVFGLYDRDIDLGNGAKASLERKRKSDPAQPEPITGATFHKFVTSDRPMDRQEAHNYLVNDLLHVAALAPLILQ